MANPYFRNIPNFAYINRDNNRESDTYSSVKNLFKRAKLRSDIFENLAFFEKYIIKGDDRPDNVAFDVYQDSTLDWVILLSNNILNVQTEWPLDQESFENYVLNKYGNQQTLQGTHHYETKEVKNSLGSIVLKEGLEVPKLASRNFIEKYWGTSRPFFRITDPRLFFISLLS